MLIAESVALVVLDPDGSLAAGVSQTGAGFAVTAGLVAELVWQGHVTLADGRVALAGSSPDDPLLQNVLGRLARIEGRKLAGRLGTITKAGWPEVVDRMVGSGLLVREHRTLRPDRQPPADPAAHAALRAGAREAGLGAGPTDPSTVTVLALLASSDSLKALFPARADRKLAKARIAEAVAAQPVGGALEVIAGAVKAEIAATNVAVVG